jgi:AcrR family transcriptional regulator
MAGEQTQEKRAGATRERIVRAARDLFREQGYEAVSTSAVLERAGISRGGLYHHFRGKDDLLLAVFEDVERDLMGRLAEKVADASSPFEALSASSQAYLDECLNSEELRRINLLHARRVLSWDVWREMAMRQGLGLATAATREAMKAGELKGDDPEALAELFTAALIEAGTMIVFAEDQAAERERVGIAIETILEGLRP